MHNVSQNLRLGCKDGKGPVYGARSHHKYKDCKPGYWTIRPAAKEPETIKLYQGFMVFGYTQLDWVYIKESKGPRNDVE